jgi:hypothetical protein
MWKKVLQPARVSMIQTAKFPARKTGGDYGMKISNTEGIARWSYGFSMSGININLKKRSNSSFASAECTSGAFPQCSEFTGQRTALGKIQRTTQLVSVFIRSGHENTSDDTFRIEKQDRCLNRCYLHRKAADPRPQRIREVDPVLASSAH